MEILFGLTIFAIVGYVLWLIGCRYVKVERIAILLDCPKNQARLVKEHLDDIGIEWLEFLRWTNGATNRFMPMFADAASTRLIAPWSESRRAVLALALKKKMRSDWGYDEALGEIADEIGRQRGDECPMPGKNNDSVVNAMTF